MFWKIYFVVLMLLSVPGYVDQGFPRIWELADFFIHGVLFAGLFGFAWKRAYFTRGFWRFFFPAVILWNGVFLFFIPWHERAAQAAEKMGLSQPSMAAVNLLILLPAFVMHYLYAFRSPEVWSRDISRDEK